MLSFTQKPVYPLIDLTDDERRRALTVQLAHVNLLTVEDAQRFGYDAGWTPASEAADRIMALLMSELPIPSRSFCEVMTFAANVCDDMMDEVAPDTIDLEESFALWEMALALESEAV